MSTRTLGQAACIAGALVLIVSALADPIGLGRNPGFGWRQGLGIVVGLGLVWRGFMWMRRT
jgi:hypothetical protein